MISIALQLVDADRGGETFREPFGRHDLVGRRPCRIQHELADPRQMRASLRRPEAAIARRGDARLREYPGLLA